MLKRNVFPQKFIIFCVVGIFFSDSPVRASSVNSSEFISRECCTDITPVSNPTGFTETEGVVDKRLLDYSQKINQKSKSALDLGSVSDNDITESTSLITYLSSKFSNESEIEEVSPNVTTEKYPYSILYDSDDSKISKKPLEESSGNSSSANIGTSPKIGGVLSSSSTVEHEELFIEKISTVSPKTEESFETNSSKEANSNKYYFSLFQIFIPVTVSSHDEYSNCTSFEIIFLNSTEEDNERRSYDSKEQFYRQKHFYKLEASPDIESTAITEDHIYEQTTEPKDSNDKELALNTSSIQIDFSLITSVKGNLFYNVSVDEADKNKSFVNMTGTDKLNSNNLYPIETIKSSSELPVNDSKNQSVANVFPEVISTTETLPLNEIIGQDFYRMEAPTTEPVEELTNSSLASIFNSTNGTLLVTSFQTFETNTSSANFSFNSLNNNEFYYDVASKPYQRFATSKEKDVSSKKITSSTQEMPLAMRTTDSVSLETMKTTHTSEERIAQATSKIIETQKYYVAGESVENSLVSNVSEKRASNSEPDVTQNVSDIDVAISKQYSSTEINPESSTSVMVDQIPSVLLATENNYRVSNYFTLPKNHYSSITKSGGSLSKDEDSGSPSPTQETKNKTLLSTNDLQFVPKRSSTVDSLVYSTNSNENFNKVSINDKILPQNTTEPLNNTILNKHQTESSSSQFKDFSYDLGNKSKDSNMTEKMSLNIFMPPPMGNKDGGKVLWKPLTNHLASPPPPVEEATTERKIIWNLCFTKKPDFSFFSKSDPTKNPKEMLMTKSSNTKVFWNLCPTRKPYTTTPSHRPTESTVHVSSTASTSEPLFVIPSNLSESDSSGGVTSPETTTVEEDVTTTEIAETTDFTHTEAVPEETTQSFEGQIEYNYPVYWNVPTFQCHKYGLNFSRVKEWGLQQNYQDEFRGEEIAILYDPGEFPALLPSSGGGRVQRNGGVPQEGSLTRHLSLFQSHLDKLIPNVNFSGLAIIDFEHWRPVWRQNWGTLSPYREFSRLIEKRRHPFWFSTMIEVEATYRFELGARVFLLDTLRLGKKLRPLAKWGYYGFPFCFNYTPHNNQASCSYEVQLDNDNMYWLFSETTGYYPSLYLKYNDMSSSKRQRYMKGRLDEALRVAQGVPAYPYIWYKYHDTNQFLTKEDMVNLLQIPKDYGCKGAVIWGASRDVNSRDKCIALQNYLDEVIGPAVRDLHNEKFRKSVVEPVDENFEERLEEEDIEKKHNYDIREFEV